MGTRTCTMEAEVEVKFSFPGLAPGEHEVEYPMLEIEYTFLPGRPAYTPRGEYGPIDPPDPAEVEFVKARVLDGKGLEAKQDQVDDWAREYLDSDAGYRAACDAAEYAH